MIKFHEFIKKNKEKPSILSWPSSHAEIRDFNKNNKIKSNKKAIKEEIINKAPEFDNLKHTGKKTTIATPSNPTFDEIHNHPDIKPQHLTPEHIRSINDYSSTKSRDPDNGDGSSSNINNYYRNRTSFDDNPEHKVMHHHENDVEERANQLEDVFKKNANRAAIHTYTGIPPSVGNVFLKAKVGSKHMLAAPTSSSTDKHTANRFATDHYLKEHPEQRTKPISEREPTHMISAHVEPGSGLSLAHHSYYDEDEVLLHPLSDVTYHGTTKNEYDNYIHHVTVHSTHKNIDDFPKYKG